jgi:DNA-binding NarL/FixJ family response regulator
MRVKVVLADDQKIVRDGLALVLRQLPGIHGRAHDEVIALVVKIPRP